ncbi:unnamed protein product [Hymenolepis diminuta]|uniref:Uncharacterized protein n=1 Tax=Hymenolepis diminuta TaxID=6216 RepID=A0A564YSS3_HYMDI|nr:unnamed protein product [Hymenolepis diminuta]
MAVHPHATRITILLHKVDRSDHDSCSSYHQPMGPVDLAYEEIIIWALVTTEENQLRCLIFIHGLQSPCYAEIRLGLLSLLDKGPDVKKSRLNPILLCDR